MQTLPRGEVNQVHVSTSATLTIQDQCWLLMRVRQPPGAPFFCCATYGFTLEDQIAMIFFAAQHMCPLLFMAI